MCMSVFVLMCAVCDCVCVCVYILSFAIAYLIYILYSGIVFMLLGNRILLFLRLCIGWSSGWCYTLP